MIKECLRHSFFNKIMRVDKFLKVSRLIKRRTVATQACSGGRVFVNGKEVKPSFKLSVGDIIEIRFGESMVKARILQLKDTSKKEEAEKLFEYMEV